MAERPESIMEEREDLMVQANEEGNPTLRLAHFLNPCVDQHDTKFPSLAISAYSSSVELSELCKKVKFKSLPQRSKWNTWVNHLLPTCKSVWEKSGIYDSIVSSTYDITRHDALVLGVAERWCSDTNTFIFPWAEATITLEDMMVLGGFSVVGESATDFICTKEIKELEVKLLCAAGEIRGISAPSSVSWMNRFMVTGSEVEHEAFLTLWLATFVFPRHYDSVGKYLFQIAVRLARGTLIALAPAVLAGVYQDLSVLKRGIDDLSTPGNQESTLELKATFYLVQMWVLERFPTLRPHPKSIVNGEPRAAMWHNIEKLEVEDARLVFDMDGKCFQWQPYGGTMNQFCKFHRDKEQWLIADSSFDVGFESFARCLRVSDLVGVENCRQRYLPHRVAMQFGFDQDIPQNVLRSYASIERNDYSRPISDAKLYIPPLLNDSYVTARYFEWWKNSISVCKEGSKGTVKPEQLSSRIAGKFTGVGAGYNSARIIETAGKRHSENQRNLSFYSKGIVQGSEVSELDGTGNVSQAHERNSADINIKTENVMSCILQGSQVSELDGTGNVSQAHERNSADINIKTKNAMSCILQGSQVSELDGTGNVSQAHDRNSADINIKTENAMSCILQGSQVSELDGTGNVSQAHDRNSAGINIKTENAMSCILQGSQVPELDGTGNASQVHDSNSANINIKMGNDMSCIVERQFPVDLQAKITQEEVLVRSAEIEECAKATPKGDPMETSVTKEPGRESCSSTATELYGMELEARIKKLERTVTWLKANMSLKLKKAKSI